MQRAVWRGIVPRFAVAANAHSVTPLLGSAWLLGGGGLCGAVKAHSLEFFLGHLHFHHLWLTGLHGAASFKGSRRAFFVLTAVPAGAAVDGGSAVCAHGVEAKEMIVDRASAA